MQCAELRAEGGQCGGLWSHVGGGGQSGGGGSAGQAGARGGMGAGGGRGLETRLCPGLDPVTRSPDLDLVLTAGGETTYYAFSSCSVISEQRICFIVSHLYVSSRAALHFVL